MPESPYPMLPVSEALALVLEQAQPLPPEQVPLAEALGRILAEEVVAAQPLPPFPASVKDGYAVVAQDGPGEYPVVAQVTAGQAPDFRLEAGQVAYITTGAPLPPGADAVVPVEETEPLDGDGQPRVRIHARVRPGQDVRAVGVDVAAGQPVLAPGEQLGPAELGLLATVGRSQVWVHPRPRVAVMSTGDELVEPGQPLGPGQIWDSNRTMLLAAVREAGGVPVDLGSSGDSQAELEAKVQAGLAQADVLLTSGGVSMGDLDLIKPLLEHAGRVHFGRIRMKPGKPLTFATAQVDGRRRLVFGLPGNPVSSLVTFYLMAVPALRKLAGWPRPELTRIQARLAQPLPLDPERPEFHRATLVWDDGERCFWAHSTGSQASSRLLSMRSANALLELPQDQGELPAGSWVHARLIGELGAGN